MTTAYTSLLGFALPVTGELSGTWGDVVNNSITQLVEDSVAGYATASVTSGNWTLTTSGSGAANQARMAILRPTGTPGTGRSILAPNSSKAYIIDNQSDSTVTIKGSTGPTTGVAVASGKQALVAWNGSDFVQVGASAGGSNTQIQYNSSGALAGSSSLTWDGTYLTAGSIKNSALTSTRITYAGASGLLSDSANLTWDGTNVQIGATGALRWADSDSSNYVAFKSPGTVSANVTWTLPSADGTSNQVLTTNGSGTLSWSTPSAGVSQAKVTAISMVFGF